MALPVRLALALALALVVAGPLRAARLAGTVLIRKGAVSAISGRGEDEQVRRGVRSLRVDLGERLRTSPALEASFLAHDETMVPLAPAAIYQVSRDGLWQVLGEGRLRVLEFLRPPGRGPRRGDPAGDRPLANVRTTGAPRVRTGRDFEPRLLEGDLALTTNSSLALGLDDRGLLALVEGGRALLDGSTQLRLQRKALVMEEGSLFLRAGGPARVVLTPRFSIAASSGALFQVMAESDGYQRIVCLAGRLLVGPPPGLRGSRHRLGPGWVLEQDPGSRDGAPRELFRGPRLEAARSGLQRALEGTDPQEAADRALEATRLPLEEDDPETGDFLASRDFPQENPPELAPAAHRDLSRPSPRGDGLDEEADRAVARSLSGSSSSFGSEWQTRDRRAPRRSGGGSARRSADPRLQSAPANLPPGLVSSTHGMTSPQHPLWATGFQVGTPAVPSSP